MMVVTAHQPNFLPYTGFIDKADRSDVFVILDTVQFEKNGWQNRNKIRTKDGWMWLTVPILHKFGQAINEVRINSKVRWGHKHMAAMVTNYSKACYFKQYREFFNEYYQRDWELLSELNIGLIKYLFNVLGLSVKILIASEMGELPDEPNYRLIEIVRCAGGDKYLAGPGAMSYMNIELFLKSGIEVEIQKFTHPVYNQLYEPFEPGLSVVDLLFNRGDSSLSIIRNARSDL